MQIPYIVWQGKYSLAPVSPPSRSRAGAQEEKEERYMQIAAELTAPQTLSGTTPLADAAPEAASAYAQYKVIRRNGAVVGFEPGKISVAVTKAFLAVEGGQGAASARI